MIWNWNDIVRLMIFSVANAVLLWLLMYVDSKLTKYKDFEEIKKGNAAVTVRFVMKLLSQAYILSQVISSTNQLFDGLIVSAISFFILLILEVIVRKLLQLLFHFNLEAGIQQGIVPYALLAGSLHLAGALIIGAFP